MKVLIILCCAILYAGNALGESSKFWNSTDVDILKSELLKDYDRLTRPAANKASTKLYVGINVLHIEIYETRSVMETHAWLMMNWTDDKLIWNPKENNDISNLRVTADEIWQPDLTVYNSAEERIVDHFAKTNKIVYNNGQVLWVPTAKFETYCDMDLKMWPFDEQKCLIKMGSWTFDSSQISLRLRDSPIDLEYYKHLEWTIKDSHAEHHSRTYPCCVETYDDITFHFTLQRHSPMYKAIAVVPTIAIVFIVLVAFWLPPDSGEKFILNGFAAVLIAILIIYYSRLFPAMATTSPLIVSFYSHTLYLLAFQLIISVVVINISRKKSHGELPSFAKNIFLNGIIEKIFACKKAAAEKSEGQNAVEEGNTGKTVANANKDWIRFAVIIDRVAFVVYIIIFICMGFFHFI